MQSVSTLEQFSCGLCCLAAACFRSFVICFRFSRWVQILSSNGGASHCVRLCFLGSWLLKLVFSSFTGFQQFIDCQIHWCSFTLCFLWCLVSMFISWFVSRYRVFVHSFLCPLVDYSECAVFIYCQLSLLAVLLVFESRFKCQGESKARVSAPEYSNVY